MNEVLLIEDDIETAEGIKNVLEQRYRVTWCSSAFASIKACKESKFSVLIVDVHLSKGDGDGIGLAGHLTQLCPTASIFIYSARALDDDARRKVIDLGAVFISKPVSGAKLIEIIESKTS